MHLIVVGTYVLTGDVGTEDLEPVSVLVQNQARLAALRVTTVAPGAKEDTKLERHVEPWKAVLRVETYRFDAV